LYDALDFSTDHDGGGGQTRESLSRIASPSAAVAGLDPARFAHQIRRSRQVLRLLTRSNTASERKITRAACVSVRAGLAVITARRLKRTKGDHAPKQPDNRLVQRSGRKYSFGARSELIRVRSLTGNDRSPTASPARVFFGGCRRRRPFPCATDQMQTRNSTPGQTKRMTNVITKVMAIAILAINGNGGVVDCVGPSRRRDGRTFTRRSSRVIARTAASQTQNNPTL